MSLDTTGTTGTGTHTHTRTRVRTTRRRGIVRAALGVAAWWRAAVVVFARVRGEIARTVTLAGWIAVVVAVVGTLLGWIFGWSEWVAGGLIAVALLVLASPFLFGARAYEVGLGLDGTRTVAGGSVSSEVTVSNRTQRTVLPGRLDVPVGDGIVEVPVPLLRADARMTHAIDIPTPRRGVIPVGPAITVRTDPVGLLRREHEWQDEFTLFVHPRTVTVPSTSAGLIRDLEGNPTTRLVDNDMSFHAIREYAPGDSRRQVHWKSTAKTGKLMVRQFEETRRSRLAIAIDVAREDYASVDEYELGVSAAASLGVQALRDGRDVDIVTGAEIPRVVRGRLRAIRSLGAVTPRSLMDEFCRVDSLENTMSLEEVTTLQAEDSNDISIAILVVGSRVGIERLRRAALAYPSDVAVVAVVCDEMAHPRIRPISALTIATIGVLEDLPSLLARGVGR